MHPVSTALFILGYGLAVPIAARFSSVVARSSRPALWGHQFGLIIVMLGWLLRSSVTIIIIHVAWLATARVWFWWKAPEEQAARAATSRTPA